MTTYRASRIFNINVALAVIAVVAGLVCRAPAQTETVLYGFRGGSDGAYPGGGLVLDPTGNLYGTTNNAGNFSACGGGGCGVVFELSRTSATTWRQHVIHTFTGGQDGGSVFGGNLIFDAAGNLYGQASYGGNLKDCVVFGPGCGAVFELSRASTGGWKEKTLYAFKDGNDGSYPLSGVVADAAGNLYGTTEYGGSTLYCNGSKDGCGSAFMLSPTANGWKETVLYHFTEGKDGGTPYASLVVDAAGNVYGTALEGGFRAECGGFGCGVVFELSPTSTGAWQETVLHAFTGHTDGAFPWSGLVADGKGNLYGTAQQAGNLSLCRGASGAAEWCSSFRALPRASGRKRRFTRLRVVSTEKAPWAG